MSTKGEPRGGASAAEHEHPADAGADAVPPSTERLTGPHSQAPEPAGGLEAHDSQPTGPLPLSAPPAPVDSAALQSVDSSEAFGPTSTNQDAPPAPAPELDTAAFRPSGREGPGFSPSGERAITGPFQVDDVNALEDLDPGDLEELPDDHGVDLHDEELEELSDDLEDAATPAEGSPMDAVYDSDLAAADVAAQFADEDLLPELDGPPTVTSARVLPDALVADDFGEGDALDGPDHLSEGEEAISDTFRAVPGVEPGEDPLPQLRAKFVGRGQQLSTLRDLFLEARQKNRLCFVSVLGEPGAGKGRLTREFARSVRAAFSNARVLTGDIVAGGGRRYEVVARAVEERIGIGRDDTPEDARSKIQQAVAESLPANYHEEVMPLVAHLLGVPYPDSPLLETLEQTPRQLELRSYIAVRRFLQHDAERGPLLLCFDGMEQSSDDSVKLVHYLADGLQHRPVMILAAARRTVLRRHPNWGQGDFDSHELEVGRMSEAEGAELLADLLHLPLAETPEALQSIAKERLGGSPRAIEDFARFVVESGVVVPDEGVWQLDEHRLGVISLPRTHEDILRARLRALPTNERSLLEKAATIGETFWLDASVALVRAANISRDDPDGPTLQAIAAAGEKTRVAVGATLRRLTDRGLVVEVPESSIVGERELRFAYAPIWDLTYEGVETISRQRYHRLVAQWLEARPEGRDEVRQALVARHLEQADDRRGASARYRRAADAARARFANQRAIRLYESALTCLGDSDLVTRLHLWHDLGSVYQHRGDFDAALDAFERMVRLGWVVASRPKAAVAFNKMGRVWRQKGNLNLALEYLQRSLEMFRESGDERGVATSLDDIGQVQWMLGRYEAALDQSAKGLEMRRAAGDKRSIAVSLSNIGNIEKDRGLFDEAMSCYQEALRLRGEVGDNYGYVVSLNNLAALAYERGELEEARKTWEQALGEADRIGAPPLALILLNNLGEIAIKDNKAPEARERLEQALALATEIDDQRAYIDVLRNLALLELLEGHPERARRYARECLNLARRAHLPEMVGKAQMALAEIAAQTLFDASAPDGQSGAEGFFQQAISVFREMGNEAELAKALRRLGEYRIEQGHVGSGGESLREAVSLFAKLGMPDAAALEQVLTELDQTGPPAGG